MTAPSACTLCGETRGRVLFRACDRRFRTPGQFAIVRCGECGLVRTDPQPDDLAPFYPRSYYSYAPPVLRVVPRAIIRRAYGRPFDASLSVKIAAVVGARRLQGLPPPPPGELLDVGSGSGAFLLGLEDAGWTCSGVEIDSAAVEAARAAGLKGIRRGDLAHQDFGAETFDVVRFWHSLEHMRSPRAQLREARRVLRRGGKIMIGVPNFASPLARLARARWFNLDVPRHLWHFERRTLLDLVEAEGFRVTRVRTASYGAALLGTVDYVRGTREHFVHSRKLWFAAQPVAWLLDLAGQGDELELHAVAE